MVELSADEYVYLPGVDEPDEGHEEGVEDEHNCFLFDDSVGVFVEVGVFEVLDGEGHEGCREEHADWVLEGEVEFLLGCGLVFLEVGDVVEDEAHHEFVEADDGDDGEVDDEDGGGVLAAAGGMGGGVFD